MERATKSSEDQRRGRPTAERFSQSRAAAEFVDGRAGSAVQRRLANGARNSRKLAAQNQLADAVRNSPRMVAQRAQVGVLRGESLEHREVAPAAGERMAGTFESGGRDMANAAHHSPFVIAQRKRLRAAFGPAAQRKEPARLPREGSPRKNDTGLPDDLKSGIERLSGVSMDNVTVHYNSSEPAQLSALAYAQSSDIHVAPGQERHLPHEAWHVVQQAQGRVRPTMQMGAGVLVNEDEALEREADVMGSQALQHEVLDSSQAGKTAPGSIGSAGATIQRKIGFEMETTDYLPRINVPPLRPARRKELLHQGTDFKLEGDDSTGGQSPSIEFVTSAYDISKTGMSSCMQSFAEIRSIIDRIEKSETNAVLKAPKHQLSNQAVELTRKEDHRITFKMQITQGVSLEDLPTVMKYFGTNVPGETPKEGKERRQSRKLMATAPSTDLLGRAPSLAQAAIDYLYTSRNTLGITEPDATHFQGSQPRLLGFLAQIILYVKALTLTEGQLQKYKMPFLGRVEFGALFKELSAVHRRILAHAGASALISAVVHAANSVQLWNTDKEFAPDKPLLRAANIVTGDNVTASKTKVPVMQSLTIGDWLGGITRGIDWLTASSMDIWLTHVEQDLNAAARNQRTDLLESFNMLGDHVGDATDTADRPGTSGLSVLENRSINPGGRFVTIDQAKSAARANLQFLLNLKTKAGVPGKFPTVKVPK